MNPLAYKTTGLALKFLTALARARVTLHDQEMVPREGGTIFVVNHFTRFETLLLPYYLSRILERPVWSLAAAELFSGLLGRYLDLVGAVSVGDPERDQLVIRTLVAESTPWIIFPEGRMVKNRKVVKGKDFLITTESGPLPPHTGAAALALRAEILRRRLTCAGLDDRARAELLAQFGLTGSEKIAAKINIVPVNISYYPLDFTDTLLGRMFPLLEEKLSPRAAEELVVEGSMLLSGVDIDIRFGRPLPLASRLEAFYGNRIPDFNPTPRNRGFLRQLTREFMSAIYSLTTVNLDHLLATLLYKTGGRVFAEESLRRRVFLAASGDWTAVKALPHRGLSQGSQVDLLLAVPGDRVDRLLQLAREKNLLVKVGNGGEEGAHPRKWRFLGRLDQCQGLSFHTVRLENPLLVMANTIEPLRLLQRRLRWLSWSPDWWLRRRVEKRLEGFIEENYAKARHAWKDAPDLCPLASGAPYLLKRRSETGIVLLHDWLAAPGGLRTLADFFADRGYRVIVPVLPGHGTVAADLEKRDYEQWLEAVDEALAWVLSGSRKAVIGGVGRSAALALLAAARRPQVAALLALFPVFGVDYWGRPGCPADGEGFCYEDVPAASRRQARKMLVAAARQLNTVRVPFLMLQGRDIGRSRLNRGERYFEKLGSEQKELLELTSSELAALTSGPGAAALADFIRRSTGGVKSLPYRWKSR